MRARLAEVAAPVPPVAQTRGAANVAVQTAIAFLAAAAFYVSLYGELPYHDVARFVAQIESDRFVWDIGHVLLQPVTLLWHRYLGFGESAEMSQKHINTVATAAGIAVFYLLLCRLRVRPAVRIAASVVVGASASLMILAPSGHMKLLAFPFLTGALMQATLWERTPVGVGPPDWRLAVCGCLLAVAAALLASCLAAAPFVGLAILLATLRRGEGWTAGVWRGFLFGLVCGLVFLAIVCAGYVVFTGNDLSLHGLTSSVASKQELRSDFADTSLVDRLARGLFGTVNNIVAAPALGSVVRAWLAGQVPSLRPYAGTLLSQLVPWFATLVLLGLIYCNAVRRIVFGARVVLPFAFLCGAQCWAVWYNLNDPEHWFALTAPTLVLLLLTFPSQAIRIIVPLWAVVAAAVNLAIIGVPVASFPLHAAEADVRARVAPNDLLVSFAAYPGRAYLGFFDLPGLRKLQLDNAFHDAGSIDAFFATVQREFSETWARGGRVFVFDVLDPADWDAPWLSLLSHHLSKQRLFDFFYSHYDIRRVGAVGRLQTWEILPPSSAPAGRP